MPRCQRPIDGKGGVLPTQTALVARGVRLRHLVLEVRLLTDDKKSVGTALGYPDSLAGSRIQIMSEPLTKTFRTLPQVDHDIENSSCRNPDKLCLGSTSNLVM